MLVQTVSHALRSRRGPPAHPGAETDRELCLSVTLMLVFSAVGAKKALAEHGIVALVVPLIVGRPLDVSAMAARVLHSLSVTPEGCTRICEAGGVAPLLEGCNAEPGLFAQRCAGAIANLAIQNGSARKVVENGGIPIAVPLLTSDDPVMVQQSCRAVFALAGVEENREPIVEEGALPGLLECAHSFSSHLRGYALGALANLAISKVLLRKIWELNVLDVVVPQLGEKPRVAQQALRLLSYLTLEPMTRPPVAERDCLGTIAQALSSPSTDVRRHAASCLEHIAHTKSLLGRLVESGAVPLLVSTMEHDTEHSPRKHALRALLTMSSHEDVTDALIEAGGVPALFRVLGQLEDADAARNAACTIANIAMGDEAKKDAIAGGDGMAIILSLAIKGHPGLQEQCARCLFNLTSIPQSQRHFDVDGAFETLVSLMMNGASYVLRHHAAGALVNLATERDRWARLGQAGAVLAFARAIWSEHDGLRYRACKGMRALGIRDIVPLYIHSEARQMQLNMAEMLRSADFADVEFYCRSSPTPLNAHRVVLCPRSPVLSRLLLDEVGTGAGGAGSAAPCGIEAHLSGETVIVSVDEDAGIWEVVLRFIYTGTVHDFDPSDGSEITVAVEHEEALRRIALALELSTLVELLDAEAGTKGSDATLLDAAREAASAALCEDIANMCSKEILSDVTFRTSDGAVFRAHKAILCARCEYLRGMLGVDSRWVEASSDEIKIAESGDVFRAVLAYVYGVGCHVGGNVEVPEATAAEIMQQASMYMLYGLSVAAERTLGEAVLREPVRLPETLKATSDCPTPVLRSICVYKALLVLRDGSRTGAYPPTFFPLLRAKEYSKFALDLRKFGRAWGFTALGVDSSGSVGEPAVVGRGVSGGSGSSRSSSGATGRRKRSSRSAYGGFEHKGYK